MNAKMKFRLRSAFVVLASALPFLQSCSFQEVNDPGAANSTWLFKSTNHRVVLSNANGQESSTFYDLESLFLDLFDLVPLQQYCIEVADVDEVKPFRVALVVSDSLGRILDLPLLYDIGFDPVNNKPVLPGNYEIRVQRRDCNVLPDIPFRVVAGQRPGTGVVIPTNSSGQYNGGVVSTGGDLYAKVAGLPSSAAVRLYVVADKRRHNIGESLNDISGGFETATTTAGGELPPTLIWPGVSASPGTALDLIVDFPPFGEVSANDVLREAKLVGVTVQNLSSAADIITNLTANENGLPKDVFTASEMIFVLANPPQQPLLGSGDVSVYGVVHQQVWTPSDRLIAVANELNRTSHDMPNLECARALSGSKALFPIYWGSGIRPGRYDVIIDIGRNNIYDRGTDLLDGGARVGFTVPGKIDSIRMFLAADRDFRPEDVPTNVYAKLVREDDSPMPGIPVTFEIISGPGTLSLRDTITDATGVATAVFSGGNPCVLTIVRATATIKNDIFNKILVERFSIVTKASVHDQGRIITDH